MWYNGNSQVYDRETIKACLASVEISWSDEQLDELGHKIYALKLEIKRQLGYDPITIPIPRRFFETPSMGGSLSPRRVERMLTIYREESRR